MFKLLLNEIYFNNHKINLDIYKTDFNGQNILHYSIQLKQKETILYLIKIDADYNKLINAKDIKGKKPADFDKAKSFENELCSIWDAAKNNDIKMLNLLLKDLQYYTINEQTYNKGNTPLHIAVKNRADKAVLYLILNGAEKGIKNKNGLTAFEYIKNEKNVDKKWLHKVKKILDGKIKNYIDLDSCNFEKLVKTEKNKAFTEKKNITNGKIKKIYDEKKEKNEDELDKLSQGISTNTKLRELLSVIINNIKEQKIDLNQLLDNYDKTHSGIIGDKEFNDFLSNINNINKEDIIFLKSFLEKDKNGFIIYKELAEIISD
jgi:hypothetical protein